MPSGVKRALAKAHAWNDQPWLAKRAKKGPLSIYELQPKSWKGNFESPPNFKEMAKELIDYCKKMHFTHVELYGLMDHHNPAERGYQVSHYFAPYSRQGSSEDLKYLIDELHQAGIGVVLDWVMAHFHPSSSSLYEYGHEHTPWGTYYFDYTKEETGRFMRQSALYWIEEMHVDGLRFDAVSQMIHRDGTDLEDAKRFLRELNEFVHKHYPGVLLIAEDTSNHPEVLSPGGLGFDLKWGIGWSRNTRDYFHNPQDGYQKMVSHLLDERQIHTHSHDDSDENVRNSDLTLYNYATNANDDETRFANLRNFFSWQILSANSGYLIHMGDELGQPECWYERFRKRVSSVDWSLEGSDKHKKLQKCVRDLNALYQKTLEGIELLSNSDQNAILAYHRKSTSGKHLTIIHNFSDKSYSSYDIPITTAKIKKVAKLFDSDAVKYGGSGQFAKRKVEIIPHSKKPNALRVAIAPHSTLVFEETF